MRNHASRLSILFFLFSAIPLAAQEGEETEFKIELPKSVKLKVSGELRWRAESRIDYDFDDNRGSNPGFIEQRARAALDFEVNEAVRVFLQFQDTRTFGEETSTTDRSADGFDLHQGFLDWNLWEECHGTLRLGRQEISLGDQRLVSPLNWLNQGRSFDGARFDADPWERVHMTAFATVLRQDRMQTDNQGSEFGGLQFSSKTQDEALLGDVYLFVLLDEETPANGTANRWTLGTRVKGEHDAFDAGFEGALQFGEQDNADIPFGDVYALHIELGWTLDAAWKPRLYAEYNFATGNDPNSNDNERFNNLFPLAHAYLGYMDFALWENISHFAIGVIARPTDKSKLRFDWHNYRTDESRDRFGGPTNVLTTGTGGAAHLGDEFNVTHRHDLRDGLWGEAGVGVFVAGDGVRDARGSDDTALFFYYMLGLRF